jgi:hypothetical protein
MLIGILTDPGVGGTFLTWSLHYLAGHDTYYNFKEKTFLDLTTNPLTDINSHNFKVNQPNTSDEFDEIVNDLSSSFGKFDTIYFHNLRTIPVTTTSICTNTSQAVSQLQTITDRIIVLSNKAEHSLYSQKFNGRVLTHKFNSAEFNKNFTEQYENFIDTFYSDSKKQWDDLGLTNKWDQREFLALNLRPFNIITIIPNVNLTSPHYRLDTFDLYNQFDKSIGSMFNWLGITIDSTRWTHWINVYHQWQLCHQDRQQFVEYFDIIIDSIVNNCYLDLTRFNLDIVREAVIQHVLIYKYGLTIKGFGLEQFPNNTQDLYKLLEPNTYHEVKDIYNTLKRK